MSFSWVVHEDGYSWREQGRNLFLEPRVVRGRVRSYRPDEEFPCLYRQFAETRSTPNDMLTFANQFGRLFRKQECHCGIHESFSFWKTQIDSMQDVLSAWDQVGDGAGKKEELNLIAYSVTEKLSDASFLGRGKRIPQRGPGKPVHFNPLVRMCVELDEGAGKLKRGFEYFNLIQALWDQVTMVVSREKHDRSCLTCGKWFRVSPDQRRPDARYCQELCRVTAYRQRIKSAKQLYDDGYDITQIAEKLGVPVGQITIWVGEVGPNAPERKGIRITGEFRKPTKKQRGSNSNRLFRFKVQT